MNPSKWLLLGVLALSACRDLDYPQGDEVENLPPEVAFLSPAPGEVVTLSPIISLDVRDPNGIADVTLFCGGVPIFVWTAPPYLANVTLGSCPGTTNSAGQKEVVLQAVARDLLGLPTRPGPEQLLRLDVSVAQLTLSAPGRAAPNGRLEIRVQSDRPLGAIPTVRIGSLAATVTQRGASLNDFDAVFDPLPGLGTDLYDGGTEEIPLEVLEELERPLLVEVEGHATSGNISRVVFQVLLSRIAWQRSLPVSYSAPSAGWATAIPTATDQGLVLPAPRNPTFGGGQWLPVRLDRADGRFIPFQYDGIRDGGFQPNEMDALGRVLMGGLDEAGSPAFVYLDPSTGQELASGPYPTDLYPLYRVGDVLCSVHETDGGFCGVDTARSMSCLTPGGKVVSPMAQTVGDSSSGVANRFAVSGDTLALSAFGGATCSQHSPVFLANSTGTASVTAYPQQPVAPNDIAVDTLLPLSNGSFASSMYYYARGTWETFVINPDGTRGGTFLPPAAATYLGVDPLVGVYPDYVLAGRPDGSIVTWRNLLHHTVLEQWFPGEATPRATIKLLGFYVPARDGFARQENVVFGPGGSMTVQLVAAGFATAKVQGPLISAKPSGRDLVVGIDPQFRARWLYRPDSAASGQLIANGTSDVVYYLDTRGQRVTALAR